MSRIQPAMSSATCFTMYQPACSIDQHLASKYGVFDQTSLRLALQRNSGLADTEMRKLSVCPRTTPKSWYAKFR